MNSKHLRLIAQNLNTSQEVLNRLSKDQDRQVRLNVAHNSNTSPETLDYLSRDKDSDVRLNVAENPNTSPETLKQMSIDEEDYYVKNTIKANLNCSLETWKYLSVLELLETLPQVST